MTEPITKEEREREYLEFHASKAGILPSDCEVAGQVRMLMRDQLNHERICTMARDKIAVLSVTLQAAQDRIAKLEAALTWIVDIADRQYEQDEKLRADGARTLKRLSDRGRAALGETDDKTAQ